MNSKAAVIVLVIISLLLGVALLVMHGDATKQKENDTKRMLELSNLWVKTEGLLNEQKAVNATLETNLLSKTEEARVLTNNLTQTTTTLTETKGELEKTKAEAVAAAESAAKLLRETVEKAKVSEAALKQEIAKRDSKITDLSNSQDDLTQKIGSLNTAIAGLNQQIAKTEKELETTKGDKDFLLKELKRLQSERSELERQMNDLAFLREQVKHLKEELAISKRLDWMRRGVYGDMDKKGGQLMQDGFRASAIKTNAAGATVNVELKRDGTVTISPATNAPPKSPARKK
jgi:chromosome segregation ATPase